MSRWFRWHLAKMRLTWPRFPPRHIKVSQHMTDAAVEDFPANAAGYDRLCYLWDEYAAWFVPEYGRFLCAVAQRHAFPIQSVLDLACGTGLVSRELAGHFGTIVGLDANELMLHEARSRSQQHDIRYVHGDFRDFSLDQTFQAVTCGSDSFNYLEKPGELDKVFHCVARHLTAQGFFVFDALDHHYFERSAHKKIVAQIGDQHLEAYLFYDVATRVSESRLVVGETVERHRRIPLETADICRSAAAAGLEVIEHFSRTIYWPFGAEPVREFYLLRKFASDN